MKALACKALERTTGEAGFHFPVEKIREAAKLYLGRVMEGRTGEGRIHVNIMEKLTMNASLETLRARLLGALDAGVDGISLSAGLHAGSFALMSGHPRFRDACLGVVVSSRRALNLFMRKSAKTGRLPDYVVVEGPLAGGHLGFGADWQRFSLADIVRDVKGWLHENALRIPVIAAGGVFTGTDGVRMITEAGADGIQAATRFAVTRESGAARRRQAALLRRAGGGHRGQRHFADGLSDEDAQVESRDQRRAQAAVRGLRVHA